MKISAQIDKIVKEKSILKHPFYQLWSSGKLTRKTLQEYAKQYYKHVEAFPLYLSALHNRMDNPDDRQLVLENLVDEELGKNNHPQLWIGFAQALGLQKNEVNSAAAKPETSAFVNHFKFATSQKGIAEGIAALYAYESQIPKVSKEKIRGLKKYYGVKSTRGPEYFKVHMKADIAHSKAERTLIDKYTVDKKTRKKVLETVNQTLDSYWLMLSGIEKTCKGS